MKLFRFDMSTTHAIKQYDSHLASISRIVGTDEPCSVVCIYLGAGGILGGHPAVSNQLFLVVSGAGWVITEDGETVELKAGMAAFWESGEWHESGSHNGLMAIVIEGDGIDPSQMMQEIV